MSGGYFDYKDGALKTRIFGWDNEFTNAFEDREISQLVWDTFELIHEFDWYKSGDNSEETWLEKKKQFKQKWFDTLREDRIKSIVDKAFSECKDELYKTFNIEETQKDAKCKDVVVVPQVSRYTISEITIPSIEDVRNLEKDALKKGEWWWLRTSGIYQDRAADVDYNGDVSESGCFVDNDNIAVRPCFSIPCLGLNKGEKVFVENTLCTVIDKDFVLADDLICFHAFDDVDNTWETSSLKQYIESEEFLDMIIKGKHI